MYGGKYLPYIQHPAAYCPLRKGGGHHDSASTRIIFSNVPSIYPTSGIHGSDTAYRYRARAIASLSEGQLKILQRYGLHDIYRASVEACVRDLGLSASTAERSFDDGIGGAA
jgi:hypothetical protein